ncbi:transcription factor CPC-like [Neltuma alba]|uniref:transcription factor CPC-like n=1 Tax=Neltuma alba TaxID=207710 RepID=UPI0010A534D6|nr:transcription factor CPC-like [Prosopis alba]
MSESNRQTNGRETRSGQKDAKQLQFSEDEEFLIARMFSLVGDRWAIIAGRIPGRSAEEIEKYWTSKCGSSSETSRHRAA